MEGHLNVKAVWIKPVEPTSQWAQIFARVCNTHQM
jgi:hypothetical protein